ncbi:hypothetical protein GCM10010329_86030 [Streptomyces spiroverticillatus]|uniref:Uncharacterized protein n=1 Tax=Streptomyces finlayi TaxID=67296 RepID=A0A918X9N2_9ACTN|nr:hypothetical protein [Streptomyces finlayi]GHA50813.1 hypothetical protein GCM10010329_86030 [Streptomyces spiroverticillatus]GHD19882.1 hypothetical protein GCM10010334_83860 [Streptomyces finlayi]
MTKRTTYDEMQAAGRLRVPVAAWRWAAHTGQVPAPDAGPGLWARTAVETVDAEAVRAALRGPIGASTAADRLTVALGTPLPARRPAVTSRQIGDLARAGLMIVLGPGAPTCTPTRSPPAPAAATSKSSSTAPSTSDPNRRP